jgi:hypothetical protein
MPANQSATVCPPGGHALRANFPHPLYNAEELHGGPHERSRQIDVDGQSRRLSGKAESRDAGLCFAATAAAKRR